VVVVVAREIPSIFFPLPEDLVIPTAAPNVSNTLLIYEIRTRHAAVPGTRIPPHQQQRENAAAAAAAEEVVVVGDLSSSPTSLAAFSSRAHPALYLAAQTVCADTRTRRVVLRARSCASHTSCRRNGSAAVSAIASRCGRPPPEVRRRTNLLAGHLCCGGEEQEVEEEEEEGPARWV
jgi:hypothetical protein